MNICTVDRYIAIVYPLKRARLSAGMSVGVICAIWLAAIVLASPNLLYATTHTWDYCTGTQRIICYLDWPDGTYSTTDFAYVYTYISLHARVSDACTYNTCTYTHVHINYYIHT